MERNEHMVENLVFSGLLWRATLVLAWPHLWLQRRRMRFICGDDGYRASPARR